MLYIPPPPTVPANTAAIVQYIANLLVIITIVTAGLVGLALVGLVPLLAWFF